MKITKYEHACFTVEHEGKLLIVDPGIYTTSLAAPENVVAVVITHEHADHFDVAALGAIIAHNPDAVIVAHADITRQFGDNTLPYYSVSAGDSYDSASFHLEFFGGDHAVIHPDIPSISNLGVMINDMIFYPGDSFVLPHKPVDTLALPVAAPWMKLSEAIDYFIAVKPRFAFPTHDAILSNIGKSMLDKMISEFSQKQDTAYSRLDTLASIES